MGETKIRNMEDFARASGISRPTVAKYFNDPVSVRETTREKIERALKKFDYRPNLFAVNLNRRQPKNIGVIVPHISDPFYAGLVQQIEARALEEGYWAIMLSSQGDRQLEENAVQTLLSLKLSGAIVAPLGFESDHDLIDSLRDRMPLVFMDSRVEDEAPFVGTDNSQSVALMVDYLCRTGEAPCYLDMPAVNRNAVERGDAYVATMDRLCNQPAVLKVSSRSWDFEATGFEETNKILDSGGFPTRTVLCANDRIAFGAMAAAYQRGLRVGRGTDCALRIAGHDDHPLSRYTCPALTTVAQDSGQIARESLDKLFEMIRGTTVTKPARRHSDLTLFEAKLIMRDSA